MTLTAMVEEARMDVELDESVSRTYTKVAAIRPENTSRAYKNKQAEFMQWCDAKGPAFNSLTRYTVTGPKLHLFLEESVIGRSKRRKSQSGRSQTVGKSTVNSYVAAMVDLWRQQQRMKINNHPSPRDDAVALLLQLTEYEEDNRRRKNFEDRGASTLLDGYTTTEQIAKVARFFWENDRDPGTSMRNLLAFLLSHYALMRGESARRMELPDLHSIQLENEGYTSCRALVMVMRQGKTNQVGRIEVGACLRNKSAQICPHGLLGFYLFWRWQVEGEPFPDFKSSETWYPVKLLKTGKDPTKEMSYKVHRDAIASALQHIGLRSRAKTHVGRGSGARMADLGGASEAQIRRLGRWNNQAMEKCYLTSLPREAMRTLAGFEPCRGSFYLARASVEPPVSLQHLIFPAVESWMEKMDTGLCEQSIAGGGFLQLLQYLRGVILQDAVILQLVFPGHPIWNHTVFKSDEFNRFRDALNSSLRTSVDPTEQQLQKALPLLSAKLDGVHQDLKMAVSGISRELQAVEGTLTDFMKVMAPLTNGSALLQVQLVSGGTISTNVANNQSGNPVSTYTESVSETNTLSTKQNAGVPTYRLSRGIRSVRELWTEWHVGIGGGYAVSELERKFGAKWCGSDERRFFNRRRKIIDLVRCGAAANDAGGPDNSLHAIDFAIEKLDELRIRLKKSLNWISSNSEDIAKELAFVKRSSIESTAE